MKVALLGLAAAICLTPLAARAQGQRVRDPAPVRTTPFPDVPRDHWAYDAVEQLRQRGILRGYPPQPAPGRAPVSREKPARAKGRKA